jgi:3-oxoacyl-[acyl-carrier protein] reductase
MPSTTTVSEELPVYPDLAGKIAVVTGAAQGMGAVFAETLAACSVRVWAVDVQREPLEQLAAAHPDAVVPDVTDMANSEQVRDLSDRIVDRHGRIDIWVNNAAVFPGDAALDISPERWSQTIAVNLDGVFHGAQAAARHMIQAGRGSIINMGSVAAFKARVNRSHYGASKAAVEHLTHCLAAEWGPLGVRVNAISPGFIDTAMTDFLRDDPAAMDAALATVPLRRIGTRTEVAQVVLFLASDASSFVNGHVLAVDGGARYI